MGLVPRRWSFYAPSASRTAGEKWLPHFRTRTNVAPNDVSGANAEDMRHEDPATGPTLPGAREISAAKEAKYTMHQYLNSGSIQVLPEEGASLSIYNE